MRHNVAHRKLGRVTEHRLAMLRNQAISLLRHERIETTIPKAKELRPFVERLITIAKRGLAAGDANARTLNARRMVLAEIARHRGREQAVRELAPRFADRPGGYTRILRIGFRRGDGAETAQIELVGSEWTPGRGAEGRRGRRGAEEEQGPGRAAAPDRAQPARRRQGAAARRRQAGGQTRGGRKTTTPRKVGGS